MCSWWIQVHRIPAPTSQPAVEILSPSARATPQWAQCQLSENGNICMGFRWCCSCISSVTLLLFATSCTTCFRRGIPRTDPLRFVYCTYRVDVLVWLLFRFSLRFLCVYRRRILEDFLVVGWVVAVDVFGVTTKNGLEHANISALSKQTLTVKPSHQHRVDTLEKSLEIRRHTLTNTFKKEPKIVACSAPSII